MAEMDIERFVEAPGRDEKIKQVRAMIDSMGIEYLYLQNERMFALKKNRKKT